MKIRIEPVGKLYRGSAIKLNCDLGRFINRILGRNVQRHGLNMSWPIFAFRQSMSGVLSYYLNYILQFADSSIDRIFIFFFVFYIAVTLTFGVRTLTFIGRNTVYIPA